jgi:hypothetical protein
MMHVDSNEVLFHLVRKSTSIHVREPSTNALYDADQLFTKQTRTIRQQQTTATSPRRFDDIKPSRTVWCTWTRMKSCSTSCKRAQASTFENRRPTHCMMRISYSRSRRERSDSGKDQQQCVMGKTKRKQETVCFSAVQFDYIDLHRKHVQAVLDRKCDIHVLVKRENANPIYYALNRNIDPRTNLGLQRKNDWKIYFS